MKPRIRKSHHRVPDRWVWHHRALRSLRRRLLHDPLEQMRVVLRPDWTVPGFGEGHDFTLALLGREQNALKEINDALDRIAHGSYGACAATGLPIPAARLRAVPWTRQLREVAPQREDIRRPGH